MKSSGFLRKLGFTPNEQKVIFFLLITLSIGGGIKLYYVVSGNSMPPRFDYQAIDKEFAERSRTHPGTDNGTSASVVNSFSTMQAGRSRKVIARAGSVDLNSATKAELLALPGIGETMADRIILYRKEHGRFSANEKLVNVKGIGEKKFLKLKPYLRQP